LSLLFSFHSFPTRRSSDLASFFGFFISFCTFAKALTISFISSDLFIEYHFLIFYCGCFCYLNDCVLPCFNQRLPVILVRLVILFPFSSISSTFGKIIPILVCHI